MSVAQNEIAGFEKHVKHTLGRVNRVENFKDQIQQIVNDLGFSHFDYSILPGENNFEVMLTSIPEPLINTYCHEKLYEYDLGIGCILHEHQAIFLSSVYDTIGQLSFNSRIVSTNLMIRELNHDYGFFDCFTIPLDTRGKNGKIAFSVLSKNEDPENFKRKTMHRRAELNILIRHIISTVEKKFPGYFLNNKYLLTEKQIQILNAIAKNTKTTQQAADLLHMSVSTLNKHLEKIKESLGAISLVNAVYIATQKNIITPD